ncbi:MAG: hypothetical protein HKP14_00355 [Bacteroidia bacterium]|nr:hypothetical protein [Bacteroidia bacterium]
MRSLKFFLIVLVFSGCFEPDRQIAAPLANEVLLTSDVTSNQAVYLNLSHQNIELDPFDKKWHLKFQNAKNGWSIYMNPLENVAIHQTTITNFDAVDSTFNLVGLKWLIDAPTSKGAYPAFAGWGDFNFSTPKSFKNVYILRLKNDITAIFYKVQVLDASDDAYRIRYASLNGDIDHTVTVNKDELYTHSFLRLASEPVQPKVEPKKNDWDLCLTFIADSITKQGNLPFLPTINDYYGVYQALLINNDYNKIAIDSIHSFDEIDFFKTQSLIFNSRDQLHSVLIDWDEVNLQATISTDNFLIVQKNDSYYAIKSQRITGNYPIDFDLELIIKTL